MVQKKKLVRDQAGSKQWQRAQPGYKAPTPAPITSPVNRAGRGGLTTVGARQATARSKAGLPPQQTSGRFQAPLRQGFKGVSGLNQPSPQQVQPIPQKRGFLERIKREFTGERFEEDVAAIKAGTKEPGESPSNVDLALAAATGPVGKAAITKGGKILKGVKKASRTKFVAKEAARLKIPISKVEAALAKSELQGGVNAYVKKMSTKKILLAVSAVTLGTATSISGYDTIMTWYALDNVLGTQAIHIKGIADEVVFGKMDPQEALKQIQDTKEIANIAKDQVDRSARLNPITWAFKNLMFAGIEGQEELITFNEQRVMDRMVGEEEQAQEQQNQVTPETGTFEEFNQQAEFNRRAQQ